MWSCTHVQHFLSPCRSTTSAASMCTQPLQARLPSAAGPHPKMNARQHACMHVLALSLCNCPVPVYTEPHTCSPQNKVTRTHTRVHTRTHAHTRARTHAHAHTHTHTHTHMHAHAPTLQGLTKMNVGQWGMVTLSDGGQARQRIVTWVGYRSA